MDAKDTTSGGHDQAKSSLPREQIKLRSQDLRLAVQIAKARERCRWEMGYLGFLMIGTGLRYFQTLKFPTPMLIPITGVATLCLWDIDLAYGSKLNRVALETNEIVREELYKWHKKT